MATKGSKSTNQLLMQAALASMKLLKEPQVQEQILNGAAAFSAARKAKVQARAQRAPKESRRTGSQAAVPDGPDAQRRSTKDALTSSFGQQKMERRVTKLRTNIELLRGAVGPDASAALAEVDAVASRLGVAVTMAGNLPLVKRQKALREIDSVLDELEKGVFATVME